VTVFSGVTPAKSAGVGGLAGVGLAKSTPAKPKFRAKICIYVQGLGKIFYQAHRWIHSGYIVLAETQPEG
jgi:hypothetical protein